MQHTAVKGRKIIIGDIEYDIPHGIGIVNTIEVLTFFDGLIKVNGQLYEDPAFTQQGYATKHKLILSNLL
jgi:hypothetical protein